jgi:hypothetical protein
MLKRVIATCERNFKAESKYCKRCFSGQNLAHFYIIWPKLAVLKRVIAKNVISCLFVQNFLHGKNGKNNEPPKKSHFFSTMRPLETLVVLACFVVLGLSANPDDFRNVTQIIQVCK